MALYDPTPKTDAPVSPDFTVAEFLDWVRTKPADEAYDYNDPSDCAICQFLRDAGRCDRPSVGTTVWNRLGHLFDGGPTYTLPAHVSKASMGRDEDAVSDWTFGALATRLQALLP